eukprot:7329351-Lingulodinium_polyedra.AAC.1
MVVRCGTHQGCYKHRDCSFNRTHGQREVLGCLGAWLRAAQGLRAGALPRHRDWDPPADAVA